MRCADSERGRERRNMKLAPQIISSHRKMPLHVPLGSRLEGRKREDFLLQSDSQRFTRDMNDPADHQEDFIGVKGVPITVQIGLSWIRRNLPTTEWIRGSTAYQTDVYRGKNASLSTCLFPEEAPCGDSSNSSETVREGKEGGRFALLPATNRPSRARPTQPETASTPTTTSSNLDGVVGASLSVSPGCPLRHSSLLRFARSLPRRYDEFMTYFAVFV